MSFLSFIYTVTTALGIRHEVKQIRANVFLLKVYKRFLFPSLFTLSNVL